jgi:hypothetical protein
MGTMSTQYEAWKASHDQVMLEMTRDKWENKFVKQFIAWPPPDWTECVVTWDWIMSDAGCHPHDMYNWCEQHASRYHVHGWRSTEGFAFRFENPHDAIMFKLTWPTL